jgi:Fe-S cluster biogenesis protein NfuA
MSEQSVPVRRDERLDEIESVFDREIRPRLGAHLGDATITGLDDDGMVHIEFTGACTTCAYRRNTIVGAIYPRLREIEGVRGVASPGVTVTIREQHRVAAIFDGSRQGAKDGGQG